MKMINKSFLAILLLPLLLVGCSTGSGDNNNNNGDGSNNTPVYIEENEQGLDFYLLDDGTYGVGVGTAYYLTNIVVPSTYRGKEVTKVVTSGFGQYSLDSTPELMYKNVTLPNTIKTIDYRAFADSHLETINIPSKVTSIGEDAFDCKELKTITYEGTMSDFNKIELGERWLPSYGVSSGGKTHCYFYGENINFKFSDKEVKIFDLFDDVELSKYIGSDPETYQSVYADIKANEEVKISKNNTEGNKFTFRLKTDAFGEFYKTVEELAVTLDNDVATASVSTSTFEGNSFSLVPTKVGTANVSIKDGDKILMTFKYTVLDNIAVTVNEALQVIDDLEPGESTEYWYSVTAYVYDVWFSNMNLVDVMPEENTPEESLKLLYVYNVKPNISKGSRVKVEGRLLKYQYSPYYPQFTGNVTVTILD